MTAAAYPQYRGPGPGECEFGFGEREFGSSGRGRAVYAGRVTSRGTTTVE